MKKHILTIMLMVCFILVAAPLASDTSVYASAENIVISDAAYYDNGAPKSFKVNFNWTSAEATSRLVLMTEKLNDGDLTDFGTYGDDFASFDEVLTHDGLTGDFGIISYTDEATLPWGGSTQLSINFDESDINMNVDATYYVYLWTKWGYFDEYYYPDYLISAITVEDGVLKYSAATEQNDFDDTKFEEVEAEQPVAPPPADEVYDITKEATSGGSFDVDASATAGTQVKIDITAEEGYKIASVKYTDETGAEHIITPVNGEYYFEMPEGNVTVSVLFEAIETQQPPKNEEKPANPEKPDEPKETAPATGDTQQMMLWGFLLVAAVVTTKGLYVRKHH